MEGKNLKDFFFLKEEIKMKSFLIQSEIKFALDLLLLSRICSVTATFVRSAE
jgi:hypothetical protein